MLKTFLSLLVLTPLLTLAACSPNTSPVEKQTSELNLAELRGQWVVINYWAKWCAPCIREIPELNELDKQYPLVTVLGVNYDGATGEELAKQLTDLGVEFRTLSQDPADMLGLPRPVVLPTTIILDPTGQVSQTLTGPQTSASLALATHQSP